MGRGASATVRRCGVADSGPTTTLTRGMHVGAARPVPKQGRVALISGPWQSNGGGFEFKKQNQIQINSSGFKLLQTLTTPKLPFPSSNFFLKYGFEVLEKMNNFLNRNFFRFRTDFK
jgi:hypothetical protein